MWKHHKRIHAVLRQHHPKAVHKAKQLFRFKYPKLFLLILCFAIAYLIFRNTDISIWILGLDKLDYLGSLIGGILISFGFSAALGVGFFITIIPKSIILAAIIGGFGAMIGDLIIFKSIKFSFMDEFRELEKTPAINKIKKITEEKKHVVFWHYILYLFAGIILATPLPDEIGIAMLAGLTTIKPAKFIFISFLVHSFTIFILMMI